VRNSIRKFETCGPPGLKLNFAHCFGILASSMNNALKFIQNFPDLIDITGFYVFFWGLLVLVVVVVSLLFEKERMLLPGVVLAAILVGASAFVLETRRPILELAGNSQKLVLVTREVKVPVREKEEGKGEKEPAKTYTRPKRRTTPRPKPPPRAGEPKRPEVGREEPAPGREFEPKEGSPAPPTAERTKDGLVLPTGDLTVKITSSLLMTVPREASEAAMLVYYDGRYVGGKGAGKLRRQKDERGEIINVTYIWEGATIRLEDQPTGNHRLAVRLRVSGNGVNESVTAWSGVVYIGQGDQTVVLRGGWGNKLRRIQ